MKPDSARHKLLPLLIPTAFLVATLMLISAFPLQASAGEAAKSKAASTHAAETTGTPSVAYSARSAYASKMSAPVALGKTAGNKRSPIVAVSISDSTPGANAYLRFRASFVNRGWGKWKALGQTAAGSKNSPVQAIRITLKGDVKKKFDVYYRSYIKGYGWLGWAKNGAKSGSGGCKLPIRAYQVVLKAKKAKAPKGKSMAYFTKRPVRSLAKSVSRAKARGLSTINLRYSFRTPAGKQLRRAIKAIRSKGHSLAFVMFDIRTGKGISYNAGKRIYSASMLKGPYVAAVCRYSANVGASAKSTMRSVITWSSNEGYSSLHSRFGSRPMAKLQASTGGSGISPSRKYAYVTPKEMAKLWIGVYDYFFVNQNSRSKWCRSLYTNPHMSFIRSALKKRHATYTKAGWIFPGAFGRSYKSRTDAGIVLTDKGPYVVAILSSAYGCDKLLSSLTVAIDNVHNDMLGR